MVAKGTGLSPLFRVLGCLCTDFACCGSGKGRMWC